LVIIYLLVVTFFERVKMLQSSTLRVVLVANCICRFVDTSED